MFLHLRRLGLCLLFVSPSLFAQTSTCSQIALGQQAGLNGFVPFPATDPWRQNIAAAAVDSKSSAYIGQIGGSSLFPNFGAGEYAGGTIGIPYNVVSGSANVNINYTAYGGDSDPGPMPIPASSWVEGYPAPGDGEDRHVLVLNRDNCFLYELFNAFVQGDGSWNADSGVVWDLLNNNDRPYTWTSADAAGLPIFPGLVRYDEVAAGHIDHALRVTLRSSKAAFIAPATHWASNSSNPNAAVMGMRLRLKAGYDISSFPAQAKVILQAAKTYGLIMADNGSNMYVTGAPDDRWNNDDLRTLRRVPASAFEVLAMGTPTTASNLPQGAAPTITSFVATSNTPAAPTAPTAPTQPTKRHGPFRVIPNRIEGKVAVKPNDSSAAGTTLSWTATGASYFIVSPSIGAVRGNSVAVNPPTTTTYTLYATNHFGQTTSSVTVTVQ